MKTLFSQPCKVEMRDLSDSEQTNQLYQLVNQLTGRANLGVIDSNTIIYIPYHLWVENGGCGSVTPSGVKLVHGLDKVTTDISHLRENRRRFLVSDQASSTGYSPRIHLAAHYKAEGRIKINLQASYCGEASTGEGINPSLEAVTCPECLQELKRINQVH